MNVNRIYTIMSRRNMNDESFHSLHTALVERLDEASAQAYQDSLPFYNPDEKMDKFVEYLRNRVKTLETKQRKKSESSSRVMDRRSVDRQRAPAAPTRFYPERPRSMEHSNSQWMRQPDRNQYTGDTWQGYQTHRQASPPSRFDQYPPATGPSRYQTFATNVGFPNAAGGTAPSRSFRSNYNNGSTYKPLPCLICDGPHATVRCKRLDEEQDKRTLLESRGICTICACHRHMVGDMCRKKRILTCEVCHKHHATEVHQEVFAK